MADKAEKTVGTEMWYWTRIVISIVSFGMIFPNVLTERMDQA
jgi:hypothetical protein